MHPPIFVGGIITERVIVSIDGSNFYHLCRDNFSHTAVDIGRFVDGLMRGRQLVRIYYYNCPLPQDTDEEIRSAQQKFFGALQRVPYLELRLGRLVRRDSVCPNCHMAHTGYEEKGVDMRIGIDLLKGAHSDLYDTAVLVTGDSDLREAVQAVKDFGKHVEIVEFPHGTSRELVAAADVVHPLDLGTMSPLFLR